MSRLHELLVEDQEPFVLQSYIEERRCQLKKSPKPPHLQIKTRKPISESFPAGFCRNACLFSFRDSPDVRKSPLFDFSSPLKSPCRDSNSHFIHIPSRTAALLLDAALRIQKQPPAKTTGKTLGSGFFGSLLKKINLRKRNGKPQIKGKEMRISVKDILKWDSSDGHKAFPMERRRQRSEEKMEALDRNRVASEMGLSCSCNSTLSSVWSESNEERSEDLETSSSRSFEDSEEMEFLVEEGNQEYCSCDKNKPFCSSPFHFALQECPSPARRTPEFGSPAASPIRRVKEMEEGSLSRVRNKDSVGVGEQEEEEEKEQFSPVSVLDPPFDTDVDEDGDNKSDERDDYDCEKGEKDDNHLELVEDESSYEHQRSFASLKRTKQKLLHKLRRFERLADLNPIELEKTMLLVEDDDDDDDDGYDEEEEEEEFDEDNRSVSPDDGAESFVETVYCQFLLHDTEGKGNKKIPRDMKKLILDLIAEEGRSGDVDDDENGVHMGEVVENVSKRLESWKGVESDTINMMVDLDLRREGNEWRRHQEQVQEMATEIEFTIFGLLIQELSDEIVRS